MPQNPKKKRKKKVKNKNTYKRSENILWPIKDFEKYFMAHECMPKIFHDLHKKIPHTNMCHYASYKY